jgi:hypothetical protein
MTLNAIRRILVKYRYSNFGPLLIAADAHKPSWRKTYFPPYKANRKEERDASDLDWPAIFNFFNQTKEDLKTYFPWPVIDLDGVEADDTIAYVCRIGGNHMIVSGDKDFRQLHSSMVYQHDLIGKRDIVEHDPEGFLFEHIIRGDRSDGIPNILSEDDTYLNKKRSRSITDGRMAFFKRNSATPERFNEIYYDAHRNFIRNTNLISLAHVPTEVNDAIYNEIQIAMEMAETNKTNRKLLDSFIALGLAELVTKMGDFKN